MAKKGQALQLQSEINTDDEWAKLLQRDGLIVVDIYSEWCGPCMGMAANLKKLKLEIGGDMLQLAIAKSDTITSLERFRNKSEPTWMFISKGKMVNLMFGANAPKLTRMITEELGKEQALTSQEGQIERATREITDMADEELERYEAAELIVRDAKEKEEAKKAKELYERRVAECKNILEGLPTLGTVFIFPHAREHYLDALAELMQEAGLVIQTSEKVNITKQQLDELLYFAEPGEFTPEVIEEILNNQMLILLMKPAAGTELEGPILDALLHLVYGNMKRKPGSPNSPSQKLYSAKEEDEEAEDQEAEVKLMGIWTPPTDFLRAVSLKLFFPHSAAMYTIPEPEPTPPHLAIAFDYNKAEKALDIMNQYADEILRYGFFTSELPDQAQLIAKSVRKLESGTVIRTYKEKLIIQVAKRKSQCIFDFAQLGAAYISPNEEEGEKECKILFPDDYDEPEEPEEQPPELEPKSSKVSTIVGRQQSMVSARFSQRLSTAPLSTSKESRFSQKIVQPVASEPGEGSLALSRVGSTEDTNKPLTVVETELELSVIDDLSAPPTPPPPPADAETPPAPPSPAPEATSAPPAPDAVSTAEDNAGVESESTEVTTEDEATHEE